MKKYSVMLPIAGVIYTEVEAESEEDAIAKALEKRYHTEDIDSWDVYEKLFEGNITHVYDYEATAEEIEE